MQPAKRRRSMRSLSILWMLLTGGGPNSHDILMKNTRQIGLLRPRSVLAMHCSVGASGLCWGQPRTWCPLRQVENRKRAMRMGDSIEWHSVKPNTLGLKVLRTKTPARRQMINNMISISLDGKPCVSEAYSILFIYNSINLILVRVERKSLIRKTLILIRVPFLSRRFSDAPRKRTAGC